MMRRQRRRALRQLDAYLMKTYYVYLHHLSNNATTCYGHLLPKRHVVCYPLTLCLLRTPAADFTHDDITMLPLSAQVADM